MKIRCVWEHNGEDSILYSDNFIGAFTRGQTFYGPAPRTALEMYEHKKNVNEYYFGEIGVEADNEGSILAFRPQG